MKPFFFFEENDDDDEILDPWDGATWTWGRLENLVQYQYDIVVNDYNGIHSFLSHFPNGFIAVVLSITGPNGRVHNIDAEYNDGWGFDITSDLITIEWVRFQNN